MNPASSSSNTADSAEEELKPLFKYAATVYNLGENVNEDKLIHHFRVKCNVIHMKIEKDEKTNISLGYAFLYFGDEVSCLNAGALTDTYIKGRRIGVITNIYAEKPITEEDIKKFEEREKLEVNPIDPTGKLLSVNVLDLEFRATEDQIREHFEIYCNVANVKIARNVKGKSLGFCYVHMADRASFLKAFRLNNTYINGRLIKVVPVPTPTSGIDKNESNVKHKNGK